MAVQICSQIARYLALANFYHPLLDYAIDLNQHLPPSPIQ